jgi:hypothetical protein
MAKVQAVKLGYYNHRRIRPGEEFDMKEIDKDLYYVDEKGKRKKFKKLNREGAVIGEEERQCRWVIQPGGFAKVKVDPAKVAAVVSGKHPGDVYPNGEKKEA